MKQGMNHDFDNIQIRQAKNICTALDMMPINTGVSNHAKWYARSWSARPQEEINHCHPSLDSMQVWVISTTKRVYTEYTSVLIAVSASEKKKKHAEAFNVERVVGKT
jgi:hypothetical protein